MDIKLLPKYVTPHIEPGRLDVSMHRCWWRSSSSSFPLKSIQCFGFGFGFVTSLVKYVSFVIFVTISRPYYGRLPYILVYFYIFKR